MSYALDVFTFRATSSISFTKSKRRVAAAGLMPKAARLPEWSASHIEKEAEPAAAKLPIVVSPIPLGGTFTALLKASSSLGFTKSLMYAITSFTSALS